MSLKNLNILITAGPTHEAIDPVRFIGNSSSGKMGYAIAIIAKNLGAQVHLVSGPTHLPAPEGVHLTSVKSAKEMFQESERLFSKCDIAIFSAAVADYTPKFPADKKIKKSTDEFVLELVKTKDIALELGKRKTPKQTAVGFALETNNGESNAQAKLESKNLDFIVLNKLNQSHTPFGTDSNQITIIESNKSTSFELKSKEEVAKDILDYLIAFRNE